MLPAAISILGLFIGSFLYATALRYDPDRSLFAPVARGRSRCTHCKRDLRWFELVPLVSFVIQRGRCRQCRATIGWYYPLAELVTGLVFFGTAEKLLTHPFGVAPTGVLVIVLWLLIGSLLLMASFIDIRLRIIPDEIVIAVAVIGVVLAFAGASSFGPTSGSFLGSYALIFGFRDMLWLNRLIAAVFGAGFFGVLSGITKGRGVGLGDLKLAAALGIAFGWPDIGLIVLLSFIIGTLVLAPLIATRRLRMKGVIAFGPFLAAAAFIVMFWGDSLLQGYFSLFGII
jgi:leader peptidase (prepilin peptidase)/N-methyltransferase